MRDLFGLTYLLALVAFPFSVNAQDAAVSPPTEPSAEEPAPSAEPTPDERALQLQREATLTLQAEVDRLRVHQVLGFGSVFRYCMEALGLTEAVAYNLITVPISELTQVAVKPHGLGAKNSLRCKNFWALGLMLWLFDQPREATRQWISIKFARDEQVKNANMAALDAGHAYGETAELSASVRRYQLHSPDWPPGTHRSITGAEALALGVAAAGELADLLALGDDDATRVVEELVEVG